MKKKIIIPALLLLASTVTAQTSTVRVKKVTTINGVTKTTDTTYTTSDPSAIRNGKSEIVVQEPDRPGHRKMQTMIIMDDGKQQQVSNDVTIVTSDSSGTNQRMEMRFVDPADSMMGRTLMIKKVKCGANKEEIAEVKEFITITIVRKATLSDPASSDLNAYNPRPSRSTGLKIEKLEFYPDKSSGKFNLGFTLPGKGDTEVDIRTIEGKLLYNEKLSNFTGTYSKQLDMEGLPGGVYLLRVTQSGSMLVKKVLLE